MKAIALGVVALAISGCAALAPTPETLQDIPPLPPWNVQCAETRCAMEIQVRFGDSKHPERAGLGVALDRSVGRASFITVLVPPNVPPNSEVVIRFVDSVRDGDGWKLVPVGDFMGLPIMECSHDFCMARVHPQIDSRDGRSTDLFTELQQRRFIWVLFKRKGEPERVMIPVSGFPAALTKVLGQSGETHGPSQPTPDGPAGRQGEAK